MATSTISFAELLLFRLCLVVVLQVFLSLPYGVSHFSEVGIYRVRCRS
jgi:hypothetical protein